MKKHLHFNIKLLKMMDLKESEIFVIPNYGDTEVSKDED
jgi:hypothetical protein